MEDVAAEAGVGIATVYRRFPKKSDLLRVVLERRWNEAVTPALTGAAREPDARTAMRTALEGAVRFVAHDPQLLAVAAEAGLMTMEYAERFCAPVGEVLRRGQSDGVFRADLVEDDIPRLVLMLYGTLRSFEPAADGWRRYVELILDGLCTDDAPLPPPSPVRDHAPNVPTLRVEAA
jgi:AcrR family transcriptional regulator